ncbi:alpha,alpha-trehalase ATH1 [Ascoidea rubescens DSM 1968]|uniref:alpha,alpha-trehalase n=1 Tax=Ascoidea rubescens DSM 1968 TaxID=1344418 RepID=A0A1D2VAS3_9ASCO|nr:glycoside hydrolase family 65 protein [Ascoidea rubescens DSM 1968]ODV58776.1 glycoside hydrolase family 65 protein [Ascoidea rubescens DSM 1968]
MNIKGPLLINFHERKIYNRKSFKIFILLIFTFLGIFYLIYSTLFSIFPSQNHHSYLPFFFHPFSSNHHGTFHGKREFIKQKILAKFYNKYCNKNYESYVAKKDYLEKSKEIFKLCSNSKNSFYNDDDDKNYLGTTVFSENIFNKQPYISNGYIGSRLTNLGQGFAFDQSSPGNYQYEQNPDSFSNGWPLFNKRFSGAFIAGFYNLQYRTPGVNFPELLDIGYESVLSAIPQFTTLNIKYNDLILNPELTKPNEISNYSQIMSLNNAIVQTSFIWQDALKVSFETFAHRSISTLALVSLNITNLIHNETHLEIIDNLNFNTSQRCDLEELGYKKKENSIYMVVTPNNLPYSFASIYSSWDYQHTIDITNQKHTKLKKPKVNYSIQNNQSVNKVLYINLKPYESLSLNKYVGIVSSDYEKLDISSDYESLLKSTKEQLNQIKKKVESHIDSWNKVLNGIKIEVPSDGLLTLSARSSLFHLLVNTREDSKGVTSALPVSGLSSDSYGGMVFWDTDIWMIPGLLPFAPEHAKALTYYRYFTFEQAKRNAKYYDSPGSVYPWTSGRFGNCTATGPCVDYEYHINIAISLSMWKVFLSGAGDLNYLEEVAWPIIKNSANFLSAYVKYNETLKQYTTFNLTDPDEYADFIDNGAYTNAGISTLMKWALLIASESLLNKTEEINPKWLSIVGNMYIPKSEYNITLEYDGMNSSVLIKQADVVLSTYPLEDFDIDIEQGLRDMHYYTEKQADAGPAMTFPVFSIISSRLSKKGCSSQSFLKKSSYPYIRLPFGQFSEQSNDDYLINGGTQPAFPFLTANGGLIQAITYGLPGIRFGYIINPNGDFQRVLKFDPISLPILPEGVIIKGFKYLGQLLDIIITNEEAIILHNGDLDSNIENGDTILIEVEERNFNKGLYELNSGDEFIVPLFFPEKNINGSISECFPILNLSDGKYGDVANSANDGDNSTSWQPINDQEAKLIIDLENYLQIHKVIINWGNRPAEYLNVSIIDGEINEEIDEIQREFKGKKENEFEEILVEISRNDKLIIENCKINISHPYDAEEFGKVQLMPDNITEINIEEMSIRSRFIIVGVKGNLNGDYDRRGCTIAEISII